MAEILRLLDADEPRDYIQRAVHRLVEGGLVALPTDCGRAIVTHGLQSHAVQRLQELSAASDASRPGKMTLAIKSLDEALDYINPPSEIAMGLMKRGWPGPLTLALPVSLEKGLLRQLPLATRKSLQRMAGEDAWEVWLRVPRHEAVLGTLSLLPAPLVLWEHDSIRSPPELPTAIAQRLDLILEDELSENSGPPSIVRVKDTSWTLLEPGIVSETEITPMAGHVIVFVCTGNTCRSPLAEAIFIKLLADRLDCDPAELPKRGYTVRSAGLAAAFGGPAAIESVEVAKTYGAELRDHASQPLTEELISQADHIYTMTHGHRDAILSARPDLQSRVTLLSVEDTDISDPIGGGPAEYEACGKEIARHLKRLLDQWVPSGSRDDAKEG